MLIRFLVAASLALSLAGCPSANPHGKEDAAWDDGDASQAEEGNAAIDDGGSGENDPGALGDEGLVGGDESGSIFDDGRSTEEGTLSPDDQAMPGEDGSSFRRERSCSTTFSYLPEGAVTEVLLAGEWDWGKPETMPYSQGGYRLTKNLPPGLYCYKFIVDKNWIMDPKNPYQAYCDGTANSGIRVPDCSVPLLTLDGTPQKEKTHFNARILYHASPEGIGPKSFEASLIHNFVPTPLEFEWNPDDWSLDVSLNGLARGKYTVLIEAEDENGKAAEPLLLPFWIEDESFQWSDAVLFMVMTDRFVNGDASNDPEPTPNATPAADWKGGDFAGVTRKIESGYFDALGVRAIWLSPFQAGASGTYPDSDGEHLVTGYHGYWPVMPREVDSRLGSAEDLKIMIAAAHEKGIRVLMDLVVNHVHEQHVYFQSHPDWFNQGCICGTEGCDWTEKRLTCLFASYMPDIDWTNKAASEQMIADALWWFESFDLDGARIDAVKHVNDSCIFNLTTRIREKFELAGTRIYLDGETAMGWAGDKLEDNAKEYGTINNYLGTWGLDGQFDFVLHHAVVKNVFINESRGYIHLDVWTGYSQTQYIAGSIMTPFIGSHDSSRFTSLADYRGQDPEHAAEIADHKWLEQGLPLEPGEDEPYQRAQTAFCWLLTIPGAPLIYMGDEYGEYGGGDPDNRHMHRAEEDLSAREGSLLQKVRMLGQARRAIKALRRGDYQSFGSTETVMIFTRRTQDGELALVAINGSTSSETIDLNVQGLGFGSGLIPDQIGFGNEMQVSGTTAQINLAARSCAVFTP